MKSQILIQTSEMSTCTNLMSNLKDRILNARVLVKISNLFSCILERNVSSLLTLHLLHSQLAFALLILLGGISVYACLLLLMWFALATWQCSLHYTEKSDERKVIKS